MSALDRGVHARSLWSGTTYSARSPELLDLAADGQPQMMVVAQALSVVPLPVR
jgi:hypothetical protein